MAITLDSFEHFINKQCNNPNSATRRLWPGGERIDLAGTARDAVNVTHLGMYAGTTILRSADVLPERDPTPAPAHWS